MKNEILRNNTNKKAFSLVENLVVITVTALIILITVPNVIQQRELKQNRISVRKSITLYNNVLNKYMIQSTAITRTAALNRIVSGNSNDCARIREELNVQDIQGNQCIFATADEIKWDFSNPDKVIIGLKKANFPGDLTKANAIDPNNLHVFLIPYQVACVPNTKDCSVQMLSYDAGNLGDWSVNDINNAIDKTKNFIMGE